MGLSSCKAGLYVAVQKWKEKTIVVLILGLALATLNVFGLRSTRNRVEPSPKLVYGLVKIMKDGWNKLIFMRVDRVF
jgi:hypothetical protein